MDKDPKEILDQKYFETKDYLKARYLLREELDIVVTGIELTENFTTEKGHIIGNFHFEKGSKVVYFSAPPAEQDEAKLVEVIKTIDYEALTQYPIYAEQLHTATCISPDHVFQTGNTIVYATGNIIYLWVLKSSEPCVIGELVPTDALCFFRFTKTTLQFMVDLALDVMVEVDAPPIEEGEVKDAIENMDELLAAFLDEDTNP